MGVEVHLNFVQVVVAAVEVFGEFGMATGTGDSLRGVTDGPQALEYCSSTCCPNYGSAECCRAVEN